MKSSEIIFTEKINQLKANSMRFIAMTVFMLFITTTNSAIIATPNNSTNSNQTIQFNVIESFKQMQLAYNATLLNQSLVPSIDMCNNLNAVQSANIGTKLLCSVYLDMVRELVKYNDTKYKDPKNVEIDLKECKENTFVYEHFCESLAEHVPVNDSRRLFAKFIFSENTNAMNALQSPQKCDLNCQYTDADANIRIKPSCCLALAGLKQFEKRFNDGNSPKKENSTESGKISGAEQTEETAKKNEKIEKKAEVKPEVKTPAPIPMPVKDATAQNASEPVAPIESSSVKAKDITIEEKKPQEAEKKIAEKTTVPETEPQKTPSEAEQAYDVEDELTDGEDNNQEERKFDSKQTLMSIFKAFLHYFRNVTNRKANRGSKADYSKTKRDETSQQ